VNQQKSLRLHIQKFLQSVSILAELLKTEFYRYYEK